jgi:arylsulfatase A-like enzyme
MPRPNILLLFTDQQRADTIRATGNPVMRTPHLDRLVHEGTHFTSAYTASPVCVPARCSLITGQYPHQTGCADNSDPYPDDRPTFMQLLTEAGYRTHGIGKMHFTPASRAMRGFQTREHQEEGRARIEDDDYLMLLQEEGFGHVFDPMGVRGEMYYIPQPSQLPARLHPTNWVGDRAVEFLRGAGSEQPFLLWASFIHPHPPFTPPTPWNKLYRGPLMPLPKVPHQPESLQTYINRYQNRYKYRDNGIDHNLLRVMRAHYYGCVSFIDYQIGRIVAALEETGQLDNTLILFTSDHGEFLGDYNCFGKRSMLDAAARIPMLVRWPGRFASGGSCGSPVSLVDVMPTFLSAADVAVPEGLAGVDLAETAAGQGADRTVYSQFQSRGEGIYMAANRRWKYFHSVPDRREYLLDRVQDPEETRNQAYAPFRRQIAAEMRRHLVDYYRAEGYGDPLDGDGWREFPQPHLPGDPDAELLIQDHGWTRSLQSIPGYTDVD